jgi:hypothetical protein
MNLEGHELAKPWKVIAFHTFCIDELFVLVSNEKYMEII